MKQKYYVVWEGKQKGVFTDWASCQAQIKGVAGAKYKKFDTKSAAAKALSEGWEAYYATGEKSAKKVNVDVSSNSEIIWESLAVDAACSGNPGALEYQGVDTQTGEQIFHQGVFPLGTVNLGEFLAIVHGLAYLKQQNSKIPIYTDSRTAMAWVRNQKIKTNLERTPRTEKLFQLVDRALDWLQNNEYQTEILKWETENWGEIPADFGRK